MPQGWKLFPSSRKIQSSSFGCGGKNFFSTNRTRVTKRQFDFLRVDFETSAAKRSSKSFLWRCLQHLENASRNDAPLSNGAFRAKPKYVRNECPWVKLVSVQLLSTNLYVFRTNAVRASTVLSTQSANRFQSTLEGLSVCANLDSDPTTRPSIGPNVKLRFVTVIS